MPMVSPLKCGPEPLGWNGYDNTTFAALGLISLTSVDQAGGNAARLLLDRIADRHTPTAQVKLSPTLIARNTTAPRRPDTPSTGYPCLAGKLTSVSADLLPQNRC
jgi:hypothetical protein